MSASPAYREAFDRAQVLADKRGQVIVYTCWDERRGFLDWRSEKPPRIAPAAAPAPSKRSIAQGSLL